MRGFLITIGSALSLVFSLNASGEILVEQKLIESARVLQSSTCQHCAEIAAAIASMKERLCAEPLRDALNEAAKSEVYKTALHDISIIPASDKDAYILSLQKGTNCISEERWIKEARKHFNKLASAEVQFN